MRPWMIAIVAGMALFYLIIFSTSKAVFILIGKCIPWVIIVDSKATIGSLFSSANLTFSAISIGYFSFYILYNFNNFNFLLL